MPRTMMKNKLAILPLALAAGAVATVAFHPGVAYAEPRLVGGATAPAAPGDYTIDPQHGGVFFEITHLGLSKVHGRFNTFSGKIHEDEKDLAKSTVEFMAKVDSVDTAVAPRDVHLKTADFFDAAKYPELTFRSTKVAKAKGGFVVTGDLTIKDKTRPVSLTFKRFGPLTLKGMGDQGTRVGYVAEPITIKRSDYGVGSTAPLPDGTIGASDEVVVRISIEATLDK